MISQIPDWRDGIVLKAQHFQLLQRSIEEIAHSCIGNLYMPGYNYGIVDIELDRSRVQDGVLSLYRLHAVFPDGTVVARDCKLSIQLTELNDVFLYVGVAADTSERKLRYKSCAVVVKDCHTSETATIDCIEHKLELFVARQPPIGYSCVPVARIVSGKLDEGYTAPVMCIDNKGVLYPQLLEFICFLRNKIDSLAKDHPSFMHLVESLVEVESLVKLCAVHPASLYIAMMKLLVRSNGLRTIKAVPNFISYNHSDIAGVFGAIIDQVRQNMSCVRDISSDVFTYKDGKFFLNITPAHQFDNGVLAIGIEFYDKLNRNVSGWIEQAVIEGVGSMASTSRVLGAPRGIVDKIDQLGLEERSNFLLAVIGVDEEYLCASDTLCIHNPSDPQSRPDNLKLMSARRA